MTQEKIQQVKDFFLATLPDKLKVVLEEYNRFTAAPAPEDIKSFGAYHLACKGALSHMVLLLKMLQLVEAPAPLNEKTDWLLKAEEALEKGDENDEDA